MTNILVSSLKCSRVSIPCEISNLLQALWYKQFLQKTSDYVNEIETVRQLKHVS